MKKTFLVFLLLCGLSLAQTPQASPSANPSPSPQASQPARPESTPSPNRVEVEPIEEKDHKISPAEAKELFNSVDEILHFASNDTGLPIKKKVKRTMVSREQVEVKYRGLPSLKTMLTASALNAPSWWRKNLDCCRASLICTRSWLSC